MELFQGLDRIEDIRGDVILEIFDVVRFGNLETGKNVRLRSSYDRKGKSTLGGCYHVNIFVPSHSIKMIDLWRILSIESDLVQD